MHTWIQRAAAVAAVATSVALVVACAPIQGSHGSRNAIYDSVQGMVADTTDVVVGTAIKQEVIKGTEHGGSGGESGATFDVTLTTFAVSEVYTPEEAGTNWAEHGFTSGTVQPGSTITIRQLGEPSYSEAPAPFLELDSKYLLFLLQAAAEGDAQSQFVVVGQVAGMYVDQDGTFTAITNTDAFAAKGEEPEDDLPATIDPATDLK